MRRALLCALAFGALVLNASCDKAGLHPYGELTDVIDSCGASASVYLRSLTDPNTGDVATSMVLFGRPSATDVVAADAPRCFLYGTVQRDSTTDLNYGTYELDATGHGTIHVQSSFSFAYEPNLTVAGRSGSNRTDWPSPIDVPIAVTMNGTDVDVQIVEDPSNPGPAHTYRPLDDVIAAIQPGVRPDAAVINDAFNLYNFALFFSQVRVPAFGGIGMTRYITTPGNFQGLSTGNYTVSVQSLVTPTATITYNNLEDFPGVWVDGPLVSAVNISGDGPMRGILHWEFRAKGMPTNVLLSGHVDYNNIGVTNGLAASGLYDITIDPVPPSTTPITGTLPYTYAANLDLTGILPITP